MTKPVHVKLHDSQAEGNLKGMERRELDPRTKKRFEDMKLKIIL